MAMLLLDRAGLELSCDADALALHEGGARRGSVPLKLIERCVIQGASTRLDSGVLLKLAEAGVATVLLSPRMQRRVAIVLGPAHNDAALRLAQTQRVLDEAYCLRWSHELVRSKLQHQRRMILRWKAARADARKPLSDALRGVEQALALLDDADAGADAPPTLARLRGIEGAAARAHFGGLAAVLPPVLGFAGRNRRPPRDPVNALLSLGYTMLHVEAVQACHQAGVDPLLGYYHRPSFGRESMASDLIEPLRAQVDGWVWQLTRERTLRADHFGDDRGACLLGKAGRSIFYAQWALASRPWRRWLRRVAAGIARDLRGQGEQLLARLTPEEDEEP
ncbi:MAG: CRISPR-associated endonuclease Cas1 [Rubrivivax sp.]|nr:CRISPR-associated endonuclease Cas1 [Rubrivivax sp.]